MAIALPASRVPAGLAPSIPAPAVSRRALPALILLLALFVAMPWAIRPLEWMLPPGEVALLGQLAEMAMGVVLGAWVFRLIRRERTRAAEHAREIEGLTDADLLTGLGNERALVRELGLALNRSRRTREPVSVAYLDVEGLAAVNRRHGRDVGDRTLRMLGAVARSSIRFGCDAGYRVGEDEFAIVIAADREAAQAVCRRLEWNVRERTPHRSQVNAASATWDGQGTPERLIDDARRALAMQRQTSMVAQLA
jgi:diguanylate cyclase (GGDEF)-like protein